MYTKKQFGKELKQMVVKKELIAFIGAWSHAIYYEYLSEIDTCPGFGEFLLQLGSMEMGPEFERSYEELDQIADRLIAGEDVKF